MAAGRADVGTVEPWTGQEEEPASGDGPPRPPQPTSGSGAVPEWATDAVLDDAFASWAPGPPPDAPTAERRMARLLGAGSERAADDVLPRRRRLRALPRPRR